MVGGWSTDGKTFATISKDMNLKCKIGLQLFCLLTQKVAKMFVVENFLFDSFCMWNLHSKCTVKDSLTYNQTAACIPKRPFWIAFLATHLSINFSILTTFSIYLERIRSVNLGFFFFSFSCFKNEEIKQLQYWMVFNQYWMVTKSNKGKASWSH